MKNTKFVVTILSAGLLMTSLSGCGKRGSSTVTSTVEFSFTAALASGKSVINENETDQIVCTANDGKEHTYTFTVEDESILTVDATGKVTPTPDGHGTTYVTVTEPDEMVSVGLSITVYGGAANGVLDYSNASYDEKGVILGKLEKYAIDKHIAGLTLFEDGGYVMYNPRIVKGTENYITGYGFGILSEGNISPDGYDHTKYPSPYETETVDAWKGYYHSGTATLPTTINYLNSDGSEVSDFYSYISAAYWDVKMNDTKNGYEWFGSLAKEDRPIAVNPNPETGKASTWKFHVRTGADGLKYATNSSVDAVKAYNGRGVELEDYLYAFRLLLNGKVAWYRGTELAGEETYGIKGGAKYYNDTKNAGYEPDSAEAKKAFENVGIKGGTDDQGAYLEITLTSEQTPFYAMYALASSLYEPIPESFIETIGGYDNYGNFVEGSGRTPVDTILSLAPYTLEYWEDGKAVAYKRNPDWYAFSDDELKNRYQIDGVKLTLIAGATESPTAVFDEFKVGNIDAASIPSEYLEDYVDDERTTIVSGSSTFKLNMNTCTPEVWEQLFGEEGSVTQTAPEQYWDIKPWMSNDAFLRGLDASIDRKSFAVNHGSIPSQNYFASAYMINPEDGLAYNETQAHKDAIAEYYPETFGYNLEAAHANFKTAVEEMVADGDLELGTADNPTEISIEIVWQAESNITSYGNEIGGYIEDAFNDDSVCGGKVKLTVENVAVAVWSDVYYKRMMVGQFDLGFGSISGNTLDPLNFMEVLKSDNSSGFTLNWGYDTSIVDETLIYDGLCWSFDALWAAADHGGIFNEGEAAELYTCAGVSEMSYDDQGNLTVKIEWAWFDHEAFEGAFLAVNFYEYITGNELTLAEGEELTYEDGQLIFGISAADVAFLIETFVPAEYAGILDEISLATLDAWFEFVVYYTYGLNGGALKDAAYYCEVYYTTPDLLP